MIKSVYNWDVSKGQQSSWKPTQPIPVLDSPLPGWHLQCSWAWSGDPGWLPGLVTRLWLRLRPLVSITGLESGPEMPAEAEAWTRPRPVTRRQQDQTIYQSYGQQDNIYISLKLLSQETQTSDFFTITPS